MLPRAGRFGDLRRRMLSWWRSARISISNEARDRNTPISAHQIRYICRSCDALTDQFVRALRDA